MESLESLRLLRKIKRLYITETRLIKDIQPVIDVQKALTRLRTPIPLRWPIGGSHFSEPEASPWPIL